MQTCGSTKASTTDGNLHNFNFILFHFQSRSAEFFSVNISRVANIDLDSENMNHETEEIKRSQIAENEELLILKKCLLAPKAFFESLKTFNANSAQ